MTRLPHDGDPGEKNLASVEDATGTRPETCPWRTLSDPYAHAVMNAHRHWSKGALDVTRVPYALRRGIEIYEDALNSVKCTDIRADHDERDRKKRAADAVPKTRQGRRR